MEREDVVYFVRRDVTDLVQLIVEKYYRGRFPFAMDALRFRSFALGLIKDAVESILNEE